MKLTFFTKVFTTTLILQTIFGCGTAQHGVHSYTIYNGQVQQNSAEQSNWMTNILKSMDYFNLFNSAPVSNPFPQESPYLNANQKSVYSYVPAQAEYLEDGASYQVQQRLPYKSSLGTQPFSPVPNNPTNGNYMFDGMYLGNKDNTEEEKSKENKDSDKAKEEDGKTPCPPMGEWFWNGEVCIAIGPIPTWACKPHDLVATGRVATCRNKIILGPSRERLRPSGIFPFN